MLPAESPFSNEADIKELPHVLNGSFDWLVSTPTHEEWSIDDPDAAKLPLQLNSAVASATTHGITLPVEFVKFVRTPLLHQHLRSMNACYLDIAESLLPFTGGYLLRFLNDQQGCAFWYMYLNADASDHCVVSSYEYFDANEMDHEITDIKETDFHIWAVSFEAFLSRFWLENEILFAKYDCTPPPDVNVRFLQMYSQ